MFPQIAGSPLNCPKQWFGFNTVGGEVELSIKGVFQYSKELGSITPTIIAGNIFPP